MIGENKRSGGAETSVSLSIGFAGVNLCYLPIKFRETPLLTKGTVKDKTTWIS